MPKKGSTIEFYYGQNQFEGHLDCKQLTAVQSDNSSIIMCISSISDEQLQGKGYWKFNVNGNFITC